MDTVIKGFLGVFIFAMIVYLSAGLISAEMDTHAARSYMDSAKKEIAESNMSPTVITAVQEQAARNGYQMQITTYGDVLETDGVELKTVLPVIDSIKQVSAKIKLKEMKEKLNAKKIDKLNKKKEEIEKEIERRSMGGRR